MAFEGLLVTEIFFSLQGETSHTGLPYIFIRLTGCNLRCSYCDSTYSFKGGKKMSVDEVLETIKPYPTRNVLLTGGEPLLQRNTLPLIERLRSQGYEVSIETHGEVSIEKASKIARIVMDIKTPGSKMCRGFFEKNLPHLKPTDEVKFVITSDEDYEFSKTWTRSGRIPTKEILFSAMEPAHHSPGAIRDGYPLRKLSENILKDGLPVRLQVQLHKWIWGRDTQGV